MSQHRQRLLALGMVAIMLAMLVPLTAWTVDATNPPGGFQSSKWTYGTNYASNGEDTGLTFSGPTRTSDFRTAYGLLDWGTGEYEICFELKMTEIGGWYGMLYMSLRPDLVTDNYDRQGKFGGSLSWDIYRDETGLTFELHGEGGDWGIEYGTYLATNTDYWFYAHRYYEGSTWKQTLKYWTESTSKENPAWQATNAIDGDPIEVKYLQIGNVNSGWKESDCRLSGSITDAKPWLDLIFTSEPSVSNIVTTVDGRTITASVVADNYTSIVWDMGDGTIYEGSTQVRHTYLDNGTYAINVTVSNWQDEEASTSTAVQIGEIHVPPPSSLAEYGIYVLGAIGLLIVIGWALCYRHPLVLIIGLILLVIAALLHYGVL